MESLNINNIINYTYANNVLVKGLFMQDNQSQTQWSYTAGIMDSDGCFMIMRRKQNLRYDYLPIVKIVMITNRSLNYIKQSTGLGRITTIGIRPSRPNTKPLFQWSITNRNDLVTFLQGIIPYLQNKKDRAVFLLNYCKKIGYRSYKQRHIRLTQDELNYREESYCLMREFNGNKVGATTKPHGHESACDSLNS